MRGRKPRPGSNTEAPTAPDALPRCPAHLTAVARKEWRRLAKPLHEMGILSTVDRGAFAAYCQAWARWVEAEEKLRQSPALVKTPSGYVQQSPWLSIANKQLEIMGRYMSELGLTPSSRMRVATIPSYARDPVVEVRLVAAEVDENGRAVERSAEDEGRARRVQ